ncbi:hypothetical protein TRFO_10826 [Tritrichomonas foetus]|uniref:Initiator binding domain-containing protein n=1 Tax=Tritrichomonas foetus TaxID=1144522 RepID=A0A1J4J9G0_9EUKA|nr:hypothetical protein TRFO_10826 [Tritrichomonas foetus]|eukprot:OHS94887.1 hypothetical protein TRFO_10826 [Tritrichomonas foetus]
MNLPTFSHHTSKSTILDQHFNREDIMNYRFLQDKFGKANISAFKVIKPLDFKSILHDILQYIEYENSRIDQRILLTGISFTEKKICVERQSLKRLVQCSFSEISSGLSKLGYTILSTSNEISLTEFPKSRNNRIKNEIIKMVPMIMDNEGEIRKWSIWTLQENSKFSINPTLIPRMLNKIYRDKFRNTSNNTDIKNQKNNSICNLESHLENTQNEENIFQHEINHFILSSPHAIMDYSDLENTNESLPKMAIDDDYQFSQLYDISSPNWNPMLF